MLGNGFSRLTPFERVLSVITSVRPGEGRIIFVLLSQVFLLLHGYFLLRPLRDTLILVEGSPEIRAYATGAVAVTLIFLIPLYKLLFDQLDGNGSNRKSVVMRWVASFFIANLLVFAFLVWLGIPVAVPFYIWVGVFSVMVVAQFWAFAADLLNVKTGQRLFVVIMVGAALGALTGSQVSGRMLSLLGVPNLMLLSALLLAVVTWLSGHAERSVPPGSRSTSPARPDDPDRGGLSELLGGFHVVARSRYLLLIALFVMLLNVVNTTGGYILATFLNEHVTGAVAASGGLLTAGELYGRFWGDYYSAVTALQLLIQLFLAARIFRWFGVRGAILVLPLVMIANYGLIAMVPVFALVRLMMIVENGVNYSIHSTTNHTLYLPVTREEKYVGKTTIDTFFWRFGDLAHAGLIFVIAGWLGLQVSAAIAINVALAVVLLMLGTAIGRRHREAARQTLDNAAPTLQVPLPDVYVPAGQMLVFSVPEQAFVDPDPGDTLNFHAHQPGGIPLPEWVRFDGYNQAFTVRPPAGLTGSVRVEVVATDFEGLSVTAEFHIAYGSDPLPRFITDDAASARAGRALGSGAGAGTDPAPGGLPA